MSFYDSPKKDMIIDEYSSNHNLDYSLSSSPESSPKQGSDKNTNLSNAPNKTLLTVYMMKEKLKKLDNICKSENLDENILYKTDFDPKFTPSKSPNQLKRVKLLVTESIQTEECENKKFSDDQLDLFREIQEDNEILRKENENLTKINEELKDTNDSFVQRLNEQEPICSDYSKLLDKFGSKANSQSIINTFDETQGKLTQISDLLSISPQYDPVCEIDTLIQENNLNSKKLLKAKATQDYLINIIRCIANESEKSKREFLDRILASNKVKEKQIKFMKIAISVFLVLIHLFLYFVVIK